VVGVGVGYIGKNNTTIGCALGAWRLALGAWRLALDARRCAHIRIILKWSSAPFAHFLTREPKPPLLR